MSRGDNTSPPHPESKPIQPQPPGRVARGAGGRDGQAEQPGKPANLQSSDQRPASARVETATSGDPARKSASTTEAVHLGRGKAVEVSHAPLEPDHRPSQGDRRQASKGAREKEPLDATAKAEPAGQREQLEQKMASLLHAYEAKFTDPKRAPRWPTLADRTERVRETFSREGKKFVEAGDGPGHTGDALSARILQAHASPNPAVKLEGEAGVIASKHSTVVGFQESTWVGNRMVGENDVVTRNAVLEVTTQRDAGSGKGAQILNKVTDTHTNPLGKPVVVYAPNWSRLSVARLEAQDPKVIVTRNERELAFCLRRLPNLE